MPRRSPTPTARPARARAPVLGTAGPAADVTVIGIPYAIRKFGDWALVQQEVLFRDRSLREAFRGSSRIVRGHWWHTIAVGVLWLIGVVAGPVFGSLVYALLVPFLALATTLLYLDLSARRGSEHG